MLFRSANPRLGNPVIESTGTGGGMKLFCAGVGERFPDVANASRRMKASEAKLCAANGVSDNPIVRRFQWADIMAGDDIRRDCFPGAPERWRFVYNGVYAEQVRVYEVQAGTVDARVFDRTNLASLDSYRADQFLRGANARAPITAAELARVVAAWETDLPRRAQTGDYLRSDRFFWTTTACRDGRFVTAAFVYPSDGSSALAFPEALAAFDRTGKPVNPPRAFDRDVMLLSDYRPNRQTGDIEFKFLLRVWPDGIRAGY